MERRELITKTAIGAGMVFASTGLNAAAGKTAKKSINMPLLDSLQDCQSTGNICLNHCIHELASGSKMLKDCADAVMEMLPIVEATMKLVARNTPMAKEQAKLCIKTCQSCQKECDKHKDHHTECKQCGEACKSCIQLLKKYVA